MPRRQNAVIFSRTSAVEYLLAAMRICQARRLMQPRYSPWGVTVRGLSALAMLATFVLVGVADPPTDKNDPPKPLPADLVQEWKKAGAQVGWMRGTAFLPATSNAQAGDVP